MTINALIQYHLRRNRALWLARAQDAIRHGWTEAAFLGYAGEYHAPDARKAYETALKECELKQVFISELTVID